MPTKIDYVEYTMSELYKNFEDNSIYSFDYNNSDEIIATYRNDFECEEIGSKKRKVRIKVSYSLTPDQKRNVTYLRAFLELGNVESHSDLEKDFNSILYELAKVNENWYSNTFEKRACIHKGIVKRMTDTLPIEFINDTIKKVLSGFHNILDVDAYLSEYD